MSVVLSGDILGFDLGLKRTGLARVHTLPRLSEALDPIMMSVNFLSDVQDRIATYAPCALVCGIPRGLDGQETEQTRWALETTASIRAAVDVPVYEIDEAGTTKAAEVIVQDNQSVDSVAAQIILDDFITEVVSGRITDVII